MVVLGATHANAAEMEHTETQKPTLLKPLPLGLGNDFLEHTYNLKKNGMSSKLTVCSSETPLKARREKPQAWEIVAKPRKTGLDWGDIKIDPSVQICVYFLIKIKAVKEPKGQAASPYKS